MPGRTIIMSLLLASFVSVAVATNEMGQYDEYSNLQCTGSILRTSFVLMSKSNNSPSCTVATISSAFTNTVLPNGNMAVCLWLTPGCVNTATSCFTATTIGCTDPGDGSGRGRLYTWPVYSTSAWVKLNQTNTCAGSSTLVSYYPVGVCLDQYATSNYQLYTYPTSTTVRVCTYTNAQCNSVNPTCNIYSTISGPQSCIAGNHYSPFIAATPTPPPTSNGNGNSVSGTSSAVSGVGTSTGNGGSTMGLTGYPSESTGDFTSAASHHLTISIVLLIPVAFVSIVNLL